MMRCWTIGKEYLIWLDILGFDELARDIAEKSGVSERKVRDDFIRLMNGKVKEVEDRGEIIGKKYGEGEDWLLVTRSLDLVFRIITRILDHNTEYKHYEKIPLEIGIGVAQYDKWARLDGSKLIVESPTIEFLKTHIIDCYREWYKRAYSKSIKSTFVVLTESSFDEMEPLDKEICKKVEYESILYKGKERKVSFFVMETEKVIQRGMTLDFLEKIKKSASLWYRRIDRIFVPPDEYQSIIESLEKHKVVFLVGDPEIGKTYTAVRIMWDYYCKGYNPIWHSGSEFGERMKIRQIMSECQISDYSVTYFEDPFGKTRFEDREELRREIGSFLRKVQSSNARVIITSREEVFKEFDKERLSKSDLHALTIEMRLMKPSYSKEKMKEILLEWATEFDCKWLQIEDLKSFVIAEAGKKLATPLSLRDFALASKDCDDLSSLNSIIKEKSKEVKEAFAEEIAKMNKEKVMFLSIVYILHRLGDEKIEAMYNKKCKEFGLDSETNPFEYLKEQFKSRITQDPQDTGFEFTHPSYEEGLVKSWNRIEVKNFFHKIITSLSKEDDPHVRGLLGFALIKNFSEILFQNEVRQLVENLLNDSKVLTRAGVAYAIRYYFDGLPFKLSLKYIERMTRDKNREIRAAAIDTIGEHFQKFPKEQSLVLLSKALDDKAAYVRLATVFCVRRNMQELPKDIVKTALKRCGELSHYSGWFISYFASLDYHAFKNDFGKLSRVSTE